MSEIRDPETDQQLPVGNGNYVIHDLVAGDILDRLGVGVRKYGTPLQAGNGRNALQDAYEEALDLAVYLKQALEEKRMDDEKRSER